MKTKYEDTPLDDSPFDRLVDGELDERQRRELLATLDDEPGGWRRCALAFLESQCWKQTFSSIGRDAEESKRHTPHTVYEVHELPMRRSRWTNHLGTLLAMATCFFVAFYVGSLYQKTSPDRPFSPAGLTGEVATTVGAKQSPAASSQSDLGPADTVSPKPEPSKPWHLVTVAAPTGSTLQVPAVERETIDPKWLENLPPAIPEDVMQAFNRTGHQIEQHREFAPVRLEDGRQLVVPVDQVNVRYVGNGTY